jgi:hypothetical protein
MSSREHSEKVTALRMVSSILIGVFSVITLLLVVWLGSSGLPFLLFLGLIIGGLRAANRSAARDTLTNLPPPDDPRFFEHTSLPQIAGSRCGFCQQKITADLDGRFCKDCRAPIHKDCRKEHRAAAHTKRQGAYR